MSQEKDSELGVRASLSALMDGEISDLELRRLLKQLPLSDDKDELLQTWRRYHLARSALHGEPVTLSCAASSKRILSAIADEPALQGRAVEAKSLASPGTPFWFENTGKIALAASVALAVFLGMQTLVPESGVFENAPIAQSENDSVPVVEIVSNQVDAEAQSRLNDYIRTVSIQYQNQSTGPNGTVFEEIPLLRPVNQIELDDNVRQPNR